MELQFELPLWLARNTGIHYRLVNTISRNSSHGISKRGNKHPFSHPPLAHASNALPYRNNPRVKYIIIPHNGNQSAIDYSRLTTIISRGGELTRCHAIASTVVHYSEMGSHSCSGSPSQCSRANDCRWPEQSLRQTDYSIADYFRIHLTCFWCALAF